MPILAIEDALIDTIKASLGTKVRGVESLPGDWDDEMLKRMLGFVPGVFVAFTGGPRTGSAGAAEATIDGKWLVYICTGHASGQASRRRGDAQQVGAYELIEQLAPLLDSLKVPNVGSFSLLDVSNLYTGSIDRQGIAIYAMTLSIPMTFSVAPDGALASFETFHAQYDVPPHVSDAEHRKWLTGDYSQTRPEAQDNVPLPQP